MPSVIKVLILVIGLLPFLNIVSAVIMTGDNATEYSSLLSFLSIKVEIILCVIIFTSWFAGWARRFYANGFIVIGEWVYVLAGNGHGVLWQSWSRVRYYRFFRAIALTLFNIADNLYDEPSSKVKRKINMVSRE